MNLEVIKKEPDKPSNYPPLLFIHGGFSGAWVWDVKWLPFFADRGFQAYALSLRGHGNSDGTYKHSRLSDYLDDCKAVIGTLPSKPILIGHSMGGYLAQILISQSDYPGAVLMASPPHTGMRDAKKLKLMLMDLIKNIVPILRVIIGGDLVYMISTPKRIRNLFFSSTLPENELRGYAAKFTGESFEAVAKDMISSHYQPDPGRVRTPVLVLSADGDVAIGIHACRATAEAYSADFELISGSAHFIQLDVSWQKAAEVLYHWIKMRLSN